MLQRSSRHTTASPARPPSCAHGRGMDFGRPAFSSLPMFSEDHEGELSSGYWYGSGTRAPTLSNAPVSSPLIASKAARWLRPQAAWGLRLLVPPASRRHAPGHHVAFSTKLTFSILVCSCCCYIFRSKALVLFRLA